MVIGERADNMSETKVQLKGTNALIAIVVLLGFFGYKYYSAQSTLATEGAEVLKFWLSGEYQSHAIDNFKSPDSKVGNPENIEKRALKILDAGKVKFLSLKARGASKDIIVRAEISVNGKPPEIGKVVRYFRMEHTMISGWYVHRETTAFAFYTKFW